VPRTSCRLAEQQAPALNSNAASSSKCGQCHIDSRSRRLKTDLFFLHFFAKCLIFCDKLKINYGTQPFDHRQLTSALFNSGERRFMILKIKLLYFLIKLTVDFAASGSLRVTPSPVAVAADG